MARFVDPREKLVYLLLVVVLHELGSRPGEVVTVHVRSIQHSRVALGFLLVEALDFVDDVVQIQDAHVFLELVEVALRPSLEDVGSSDVNDRAVCDAADATSPFETLNDLFVAKHGAFGQIL